MSLNKIPSGINPPEDINIIVEISSHSNPIKYEIEKKTGALFVDRFMLTPMFYPCNYGYINYTLSNDGDPLDALVHTPYPIQPGSVIRSRPIGLLKMSDESGEDVKIIALPHSKIYSMYDKYKDICDLPNLLRDQIFHFFKHYKKIEKNKWVKIIGWENIEYAKKEIIHSIKRY
ncbi:inorganic diphosphatase [Buchnera aphidicola (Formosaphis micheliae)]|uniref:inorganic diphosphatase n=1 Tax=Buchnera aphidicola TaxID=9 RepID=UPI0031B842D6